MASLILNGQADAKTSTTRYVPELDGMRTVSIVLVVLSHFGLKMAPGIFGVTIFFFISGYLITGQLLAEIDRHGTVDLRMFYVRRLLRLYPALIVMVAAAFGVIVAMGGIITFWDVASALLYLVNLREYVQLLPEPLPGLPHPYGVLWSLAVEEHYYMLFPLLTLLLARRRRAFLVSLVMVIAVVTAWRVHMTQVCDMDGCTFLRVEHGTDTRIDSIVYGALLAALMRSAAAGPLLQLVRRPEVAGCAVLLLLLALAVRDPWFRSTFRFTMQGVGLFFAVAAVLFAGWAGPLRQLLSHAVLTTLGRWSYSIYLWHWMVLIVFLAAAPARLTQPIEAPGVPPAWWLVTVLPALLVLSLVAAALCYYGVERPVLLLRRRIGSHAVG